VSLAAPPSEGRAAPVLEPRASPESSRFDYSEAFARNIGLLSIDEQQRLRNARVAIAGLGGVGGVHLLALARSGVGRFAIADLDRFELANMNRQVGAAVNSLGKPKVEVMAEMVRAINPTAELRLFPGGIGSENIDVFLEDAIAAVDGIDFFNMSSRLLLFRRARARGVYALTAAPIGFGATLHVFSPDGMSFETYFDISPEMPRPEQLVNFGLGLAPKLAHIGYFPASRLDLSGQRAPSLGSACLLTGVLVATEVINIILGRRPSKPAPYFAQFDPFVQTYKTGRLWWGNRNPVQRAKKWWVLRTNPAIRDAIRDARP
jgi:molybdopterin/thiamine biosynthesis adenylyltransferase